MKAWEVRRGELGLHDVSPTVPLALDTVVRVVHSGICGSDLPKLLRPADFTLPEPWRPGHEVVGEDARGSLVAVNPLVPCRDCVPCTAGDIHLCPELRRIGWDLPGGFAHELLAPRPNVYPLPNGLSARLAVLADPAAVAIHGLRCSPIGDPSRLAIIGAGAIGLLTAIYAHLQGWTTTVVHRDGRTPSSTITQNIPAEFQPLSAMPNQAAFDVVVDAANGSSAEPLELALRLVRDGGTLVVQNAYHPGVSMPTTLRDLFRRSIRLIGSFSHCRREQDDFALALDLLRANHRQVAHLVSHSDSLAALSTTLGDRSPRAIRHVLSIRPW
jgi:D-altritol 5-dehydrogenase